MNHAFAQKGGSLTELNVQYGVGFQLKKLAGRAMVLLFFKLKLNHLMRSRENENKDEKLLMTEKYLEFFE